MNSPSKMLLILDLDETLIHARAQPLSRSADFRVDRWHVYKRPGLNDFLEEVAATFQLAIWSSASDKYVTEVVAHILPTSVEPLFVWGESRCTLKRNYGDVVNAEGKEYFPIKSLKKVKRFGYSLERVLIVDDSPYKSSKNYGNAIYPEPYLGEERDDELAYLGRYLRTLKDCPNVRQLEKRNWRSSI